MTDRATSASDVNFDFNSKVAFKRYWNALTIARSEISVLNAQQLLKLLKRDTDCLLDCEHEVRDPLVVNFKRGSFAVVGTEAPECNDDDLKSS